jgi:hypothetical protein
MYCEIFDEVCRQPVGGITFEKNGGKIRGGGGKVCIGPVGWISEFPGLSRPVVVQAGATSVPGQNWQGGRGQSLWKRIFIY